MNLKLATAGLIAAASSLFTTVRAGGPDTDPFEMPEIPRPSIPERSVCVADFGGTGDGSTLSTQAFATAIATLAAEGGGRVTVPAGVWYTGPIVLPDRTELHLERNAVIVFSDDKTLYPLVETTFEGLDTWRCQSPLSACGAKDIAITGCGVIDGSGDAWRAVKSDQLTPRQWKEKTASGGVLSDDGRTWYPSQSYKFGATSGADQNVSTWARTKEDFERMHDFLRPVMVSILRCENVLLEGVTFQNSPCWNIHPAMCRNLTVDRITVRCPEYAQNSDGIDIESCTNVIVTGSVFDVGDDGICIKSGKDEAGRRRGIPCENIRITGCTVFHGHGGFVVGSEMSGGVRNVCVSDCTFSGTDVGLRFKSTRGRGGVVEHIRIENISMTGIRQDPLLFDLFYGIKPAAVARAEEAGAEPTDLAFRTADETTPAFRDIRIDRVRCRGARSAFRFNGLPEMNVERVTIRNTQIQAETGARIDEASGVVLENVRIAAENGPALMLNNVKDIAIRNFDCPDETECILQVTGSRNRDIRVEASHMTPDRMRISQRATAAVWLEP